MHTAKELHDEECFREWLAHWRDHAANAPVVNGYWQRIERALSLLASVEDEDGIVRELREAIDYIAVYGQFSVAPDVMKRAAALILAQRQEIERVKADAESSGDEVVRELYALRESAKPFPSGAGGQQCGMESYRIVASGNQLEVIYTAAARIAALEYHAEAMASRIEWYAEEGWVNGDIPEAKAYRAAHQKDAP